MQAVAIIILVILAFLFVKYVLCDGNLAEGAMKASAGCRAWVGIALFWIPYSIWSTVFNRDRLWTQVSNQK
jgi:hypothetical protein